MRRNQWWVTIEKKQTGVIMIISNYTEINEYLKKPFSAEQFAESIAQSVRCDTIIERLLEFNDTEHQMYTTRWQILKLLSQTHRAPILAHKLGKHYIGKEIQDLINADLTYLLPIDSAYKTKFPPGTDLSYLASLQAADIWRDSVWAQWNQGDHERAIMLLAAGSNHLSTTTDKDFLARVMFFLLTEAKYAQCARQLSPVLTSRTIAGHNIADMIICSDKVPWQDDDSEQIDIFIKFFKAHNPNLLGWKIREVRNQMVMGIILDSFDQTPFIPHRPGETIAHFLIAKRMFRLLARTNVQRHINQRDCRGYPPVFELLEHGPRVTEDNIDAVVQAGAELNVVAEDQTSLLEGSFILPVMKTVFASFGALTPEQVPLRVAKQFTYESTRLAGCVADELQAAWLPVFLQHTPFAHASALFRNSEPTPELIAVLEKRLDAEDVESHIRLNIISWLNKNPTDSSVALAWRLIAKHLSTISHYSSRYCDKLKEEHCSSLVYKGHSVASQLSSTGFSNFITALRESSEETQKKLEQAVSSPDIAHPPLDLHLRQNERDIDNIVFLVRHTPRLTDDQLSRLPLSDDRVKKAVEEKLQESLKNKDNLVEMLAMHFRNCGINPVQSNLEVGDADTALMWHKQGFEINIDWISFAALSTYNKIRILNETQDAGRKMTALVYIVRDALDRGEAQEAANESKCQNLACLVACAAHPNGSEFIKKVAPKITGATKDKTIPDWHPNNLGALIECDLTIEGVAKDHLLDLAAKRKLPTAAKLKKFLSSKFPSTEIKDEMLACSKEPANIEIMLECGAEIMTTSSDGAFSFMAWPKDTLKKHLDKIEYEEMNDEEFNELVSLFKKDSNGAQGKRRRGDEFESVPQLLLTEMALRTQNTLFASDRTNTCERSGRKMISVRRTVEGKQRASM